MALDATMDHHKETLATGLADYRPRRTHRYEAVNVLLLLWADDDIGCANEIAELARMYREDFNYGVWPYRIPSQDSDRSLNFCVAQFVKLFGGSDNLIIVHYSGHGGPKVTTKNPCTWAAYVTPTLAVLHIAFLSRKLLYHD